jgi:hypothetical protein
VSAAVLAILATAALLASLALVVISLARRLARIERTVAPWGAKHLLQGPLEKSRLPSQVVVRKLDGSWSSIGGEAARPVLLVFVARGCEPCRALAAHLKTLERYWKQRIDVLLVFKQPPGEVYDELLELGISHLPATSSPFLFQVWSITAVPFAVVLDRDGSVDSKGVVNNLDHLEYLVDLESPATTVSYQIVPGTGAAAASKPSPAGEAASIGRR